MCEALLSLRSKPIRLPAGAEGPYPEGSTGSFSMSVSREGPGQDQTHKEVNMKKFNLRKVFVTLTSALLISGLVFGTVGVAAATEAADPVAPKSAKDNVKYDPESDTLKIDGIQLTDGKAKVKIFVCKADEEKVVAGKSAKTITATGTAISVALNDKQKGLNVKATKDLYLLVTFDDIKDATKYKVDPDITVAKSDYKKVKVDLNYAAAGGDVKAIASIKGTPAEGGDDVSIDLSKAVYKSSLTTKYAAAENFKGPELSELITAAGKPKAKVTVDVLVLGTATKRSIAAKTVKVKKTAKAPSVKVDVNKNSIAIKNGFDYSIRYVTATGTAEEVKATLEAAKKDIPALNKFMTILPAKKNGGEAPDAEINSATYVPDKKDAKKLTATVVKSKTIEDKYVDDNNYVIYYVRKSAAAGKPASEIATIVLAKPADAPTIYATATGAAFKLTDKKIATGAQSGLEYCIIGKSENDIDWTTVKWTKFNESKGIKAKNLKTTKFNKASDGSKVDKAEAATGDFLYIRNVGKKGSKTADPILPSKATTITLTITDDGFGVPSAGLTVKP